MHTETSRGSSQAERITSLLTALMYMCMHMARNSCAMRALLTAAGTSATVLLQLGTCQAGRILSQRYGAHVDLDNLGELLPSPTASDMLKRCSAAGNADLARPWPCHDRSPCIDTHRDPDASCPIVYSNVSRLLWTVKGSTSWRVASSPAGLCCEGALNARRRALNSSQV